MRPSSPVHAGGVPVQSRVPLHGQELHPAHGVLVQRFLKVAVQQLQRHAAEVVH